MSIAWAQLCWVWVSGCSLCVAASDCWCFVLLLCGLRCFFPSRHIGIIIVLYSSFRVRLAGPRLGESIAILLSTMSRRDRYFDEVIY